MSSHAQPRLVSGDRVGPYEILEFLGAGGMGEVYRARDPRLGRDVALKTLTAAEGATRLLHEARTASSLNHPNIVFLYDVCTEGEQTYLVMEYVPGRSLDALIPRKGMRVSEALRVGSEVAAALSAAHAVGIVHRDIKPGNIMLSDSGRVKILDFGLAKVAPKPASLAMDENTHSTGLARTMQGTIVGTAHYMSPEQVEGKSVDARSDIFSLGVVLYEMIAGTNPFRRDSVMQTVTSILRDEPEPLSNLAPDLPYEIERIVRRCLRKDPNRRFQTAADLRVALEELREEWESGSISGSGVTPAPRSSVPMWAIAGVAALVIIVALAAWRFYPRDVRPPVARVLDPVPLMSVRSLVTHTALSPDGAYVAYAGTGDNTDASNIDIYVRPLVGGSPLRLTANPLQEDSPAWSSDGTQIAFTRHLPDQTLLVIAPVLGGQERVLASAPGETQMSQAVSWTPDGKWIIWARQVNLWPLLHRVSVETGEVKRLTPDGFLAEMAPAVAPDGSSVVYSAYTSNSRSELYQLQLTPTGDAAGKPRQLTTLGTISSQPAWSPDGKKLYFGVGVTGISTSIWEMETGGQPSRLPITSESAASPTVSRRPGRAEGMRFAYVSRRSDENLWALPSDGRVRALEASGRRDYEPHISPDGKKLAFTSTRSGSNEIWLSDLDGRNAVQLTNLKAAVTSAAHWSPDGQRLVFISNKEGQTDVYMIAAIGGAPVRLTDNKAHDSAPNWSRDGKWVYFGSDRTGQFEVFRMRPEPGAAAEKVTTNGGFAGIESADGKTLYYAMRQSNQGLWAMPIGGGAPKQIARDVDRWGNFDVGKSGVYYVPANGRSIRQISPGGDERLLLNLDRAAGFGLSVSPADGTLIYTLRDQTASELMIIDNFK